MMKNKKMKILIGATVAVGLLLIILTIVMISGKDKKKDSDDKTGSDASINVEPEATMSDAEDIDVVTREGMVISNLTGEWIDESLDGQRPVCMMINNIIDAIPQSGISEADIIYEMKVEGSLTRLLCVFKDYEDIEKVGPVRSARHYYVEVADMLDGIYCHFGYSPLAEQEIPALGVNNLNGLFLDGTVYYRDSARYAPHNVYTSGSRIADGIATYEYSTVYTTEPEKMFAFNYEEANLDSGNSANIIKTDYAHNSPWFEYNSDEGVYYRYQYNQAHIDVENGEQLKFKNVIVMLADYTSLDSTDHQDVDWNAGGTAYYATNGEYVEITWKKDNGVLKYFDKDGNQLRMNPGKTFIAVFDDSYPEGVSFE